ncbi:MAG: hypothetical protein EAZ43_01685 [Betaproteobacteria bacterium]|nr:MAG: hypothetical protein EAZ43_01685 [Betaproteobacteria bacterium]
MKTTFSKSLSQSAVVAALALCAGFAAAQTGGLAGAPVGAGGAGANRMMGPAGHHGGAHFAKRLEAIKSQLNLNATQEAQFGVAKTATEAAMNAGKTARVNAAANAKAELAKADPDLGALLVARESAQDAAQAQRKAATAEWAKFLSLLSVEQKAVVKSQLLDRMQRAEAMREKMGQRAKG